MPVILLTTILTLSVLYAPQPLLPVLAAEFGVSRELAAALTTVAFIPLCLAPLVYGYLLETVRLHRLLRGAVLLLGLSEVLFFLAPTFPLLLTLRLAQGALIPALLTALMTYTAAAAAPRGEVPRAMALYIAGTIAGGFLGRALSGAVATLCGWRISFLVLAASLLVAWLLLGRLAPLPGQRLSRPRADLLPVVLARPGVLRICVAVGCLFFVFAAVMNFIPFRLTDISDRASELRIGLMYSGYAAGIYTSLRSVRFSVRLGGPRRAMVLGFVLYGLSLLGLASSAVGVVFVVMFLFCAAMFLVHATATGCVNTLAGDHRPMVNALYVAFYYGGGVLGSWLPGIVYRLWGWPAFIGLLLAVAGAGLLALTAGGGLQPRGIDRKGTERYT